MPVLTCVIPVFNGERFLRATLQCLAAQTRRADRVIVLDNCSTDRTRQVVEDFTELACEWRSNERNLGLLGNANRALEFARETDYLHLLMADDLVKPEFYRTLLGTMEPLAAPALAYSLNETIDADGRVTGPFNQRPAGPARDISRRDFLVRQATLDTILLPAVVFRVNHQPPRCLFRDLPQTSDCIFLAEWARGCGHLIEVPEYLCQYRVHPANATSSANLMNLKTSVHDEWRAMTTILPWIEEGVPARWLRREKMKCLFAARAHVKADMMALRHPDYAGEIRRALSHSVGPVYGGLGRLAVWMRDALDRCRGRETKSRQLARWVGLEPSNPGLGT